MADHAEFTAATGVGVYFADPHSPWQRGTNEKINGLLRQYFPKGTNLAIHSPQRLAEVQDELNSRSRKRHVWATPAGRLTALKSSPQIVPLLHRRWNQACRRGGCADTRDHRSRVVPIEAVGLIGQDIFAFGHDGVVGGVPRRAKPIGDAGDCQVLDHDAFPAPTTVRGWTLLLLVCPQRPRRAL